VPPLAVMNSAVKHSACHVGVPGLGSMISVHGLRGGDDLTDEQPAE
jgi:hypothetical protein